jgi:hypothetical protein
MPVIGMTMRSINAKKEKDIVGGRVKVKTNTDLTDVVKHDIQGMDVKALSIDFEFKTEYMTLDEKDKLANITISGSVLFVDKNSDEIFEKWQKDKELPQDVSIQVINMLLDKCSKKALILSDDLQLPSPIAMPFAKKTEK